MARTSEQRLIVIGSGIAGIALACRLRCQNGYENFTVYEREASIGSTWYLNKYPGVGCDVDSHLYSFSFNPNPDWSRRSAGQAEILQYMHNTVDNKWNTAKRVWSVKLRNTDTGHEFRREAEMLVSCVGTISIPKGCDIPGNESYKGATFHSARWNHEFDMQGKKIAVVGNGCSGAQLMPFVAEKASKVVQFQRSPQWINERPNPSFSSFQKWCFRYIPFWNKLYRFYLWRSTDVLHSLYMTGSASLEKQRAIAQRGAEEYMTRTAPKAYLNMLMPKFPLGCKRRIFDPGYLECLHKPNVELTTERITSFTETGLQTTKRTMDFDAVVLSTGFKIQEFPSPITITGANATFVHGFPNFGIVFGPNSSPAHNSVIFSNETQIEFILKSMINPVLRGSFEVLDVKQAAEDRNVNQVQAGLKNMVWNDGCANWNLDAHGRNTTNYHGPTAQFWWDLYWPVWKDFELYGGDKALPWAPWTKWSAWTVGVAATVALAVQRAHVRGLYSP
ncbi:monooxygenase [Paraphaeosphaeria sporulosa]